jgi:hypothetical protein
MIVKRGLLDGPVVPEQSRFQTILEQHIPLRREERPIAASMAAAAPSTAVSDNNGFRCRKLDQLDRRLPVQEQYRQRRQHLLIMLPLDTKQECCLGRTDCRYYSNNEESGIAKRKILAFVSILFRFDPGFRFIMTFVSMAFVLNHAFISLASFRS